MRGRSNIISDLAQMANGAVSALGGVREELHNIAKQRTERSLNERGLVTREEFEALCTRHEALAARLASLEATLATRLETPTATAKKAKKSPTRIKAKKAPKSNRAKD